METNAKYVLVACSIIMLVALLTGSILWLRRNSSDAGLTFYHVFFHNQSLSGLQEGSAVTMKGIPVGSVRHLEFDRDNTERIRVTLAVRETTPVKSDSRAVIARNIVTGLSTVDLSTGSRGAELLSGAPRSSKRYPEIPEGPAEFEALKTSAPALLARSSETLARIQSFLSDANEKEIQEILHNVSTITTTLASSDKGVDTILRELQTLVHEGHATISSLRQTAVTAQQSITALTRQLGDATTRLSTSVNDAARKVSGAAEKFQNPRRILTGPSDTELGPGEERR